MIDKLVDAFYKKKYSVYINILKKTKLSREDIEDIIQISLIKVCEKFDGTGNFFAFLDKVIQRETINFIKKNKKYVSLKIDIDALTDTEQEVFLNHQISNLSDIEKLKYEGYTNKEISNKLNVSINRVKYILRKKK